MKPHPKIRKTIKWGGAAVTVLLVVVWIGSGFRDFGRCTQRGYWVHAGWGTIGVGRLFDGFPQGAWFARSRAQGMSWWYPECSNPIGWHAQAPVWALVIPVLVLTVTAWVLEGQAARRRRRGRCPKCNYDRTGLAPDAKCPECGH
jgi:hypothetical protein